MAMFVPASCKMQMKIQVGTDELGRPTVRSKTFSGVDAAATADAMDAVSTAFGGMLAQGLLETLKISADSIE